MVLNTIGLVLGVVLGLVLVLASYIMPPGRGLGRGPEKIIYYAAIFSYEDHESPVVPWLGFRVSIRVWLSFRFSVNMFHKFTLSLP